MNNRKKLLWSSNLFLRRTFSEIKPKRESIEQWKSVVGLEVHAQISSNSKLFSGSPTKFSSPVNANVSLFDCSIPGTLPVLNKQCVEAGVLTALALNCKVNPVSMFDRKHYFYADMPSGYQITQQRSPLANNGELTFDVFTPGIHKKPYETRVHIKQLQLEQDSGKSLHDTNRSLVDLNRAGNPLMEVVFDPDLTDGEEAAALVKELIIILQRLGTCSCKMEEGALRVDANVSIHKKDEPFGTRTEIKNIGSVRGVAGAIKYEIKRQIEILDKGGKIFNETRAWDANSKTTVAMRDKEELQDYRYMPEPNLPPLHIAMDVIDHGCVSVNKLQQMLPELPKETRKRLKENLGLTSEQAVILVNNSNLLTLFEETLKMQDVETKLLANLIINDLITISNKNAIEVDDIVLNPSHFGEVVSMIQDQSINRTTGKLLLNELVTGTNDSPRNIVAKNNWFQIIDDGILKKICEEIIQENDKIVKQYKSGKTKVFKALLGAVANKSDQKADMGKCAVILKKLLDN